MALVSNNSRVLRIAKMAGGEGPEPPRALAPKILEESSMRRLFAEAAGFEPAVEFFTSYDS